MMDTLDDLAAKMMTHAWADMRKTFGTVTEDNHDAVLEFLKERVAYYAVRFREEHEKSKRS